MSDIRLLAIPLLLVLFAGAVCWYYIKMQIPAWQRLAIILTLPLLALLTWSAMSTYLGWPTGQTPSEKSLVLWASIREPPPGGSDSDGAIFVWLVPLREVEVRPGLLEYRPASDEPRSHELPYTKKGHQMMQGALEQIKLGKQFVMEMKGQPGTPGQEGEEGEPEDGEQGGQEGRRGERFGHEQEFMLYELPAPSYPDKRQ